MDDARYMARCLELAAAYKGRTSPNPIVGCVIVDEGGTVVAEGVHRGPGTAHAEIDALNQLPRQRAPAGATLYVNLEPCMHHGRTPPCAPVVRDSGVARVVIGMADPIEGHGGGARSLRRAGLDVTVGVLRAECERANRPWLVWAEHHRPAFVLKAAITLDGKICTITGQSKWITSEESRRDVHRLRAQSDAILVGIGTVLADDPRLGARIAGGRDPARIVLDSRLRTPLDARLLEGATRPRIVIACGEEAPARREKALVARGAEVWRLPAHRNGRLDLHPLARRLAGLDIQSVFVEGGGEVHAYLLDKRLCDELVLYVAPKVVGGPARSWVGGGGRASMASAIRLVFEEPPVILPGGDLRIHATLAKLGQDSA